MNMIGSNRVVYVWKKRIKFISYYPTSATVKCQGWNNLMVWGCMGWNNMGMLIEVKEKMNADQYCQILGDRMVESFEKLEIVVDEQYFQQDNDPKHTSKKATQYNNIQLLLWPAQSSDLDHVEYL